MNFTPILPKDFKNKIDVKLMDKAYEICAKSSSLACKYPHLNKSFEQIFSIANVYFSNKIKNNPLHVKDIFNALDGNFSQNTHTKNLQFLALYHFHIMQYLHKKSNEYKSVFSKDFLLHFHKRFYSQLGLEFLLNDNMQAGFFRQKDIPQSLVSFRLIDMYINKFDEYYNIDENKIAKVLYALSAYHRLLWIKPFSSHNGLFFRIYLDFLLQKEKIHGVKLWSISRGIYANLDKYFQAIKYANAKSNNQKNALSEEGLKYFLNFMLDICDEQINFTQKILQNLPNKLKNYVFLTQNGLNEEYDLPKKSEVLFEKLLIYKQINRGEIKNIIGKLDRSATYFTKKLTQLDFIYSDTPRGDLKLKLNPHFASKLFPQIFE